MARKSALLYVALVGALLLFALGSVGAPPAQTLAALPDGVPLLAGDGARHYQVGENQFVAVIPASAGLTDVYNQPPVRDTYVSLAAPSSSFCSDDQLRVIYDPYKITCRAYLGFDLSSIPSDAVVTSAYFYAYLIRASGLTSVNINLMRVTTAWNCPLYWGTQPDVTGATSANVNNTLGEKVWTVTSLVQNFWLGRNLGTSPNFGMALIGPESGDSYFRSFGSAESSQPPKLVVNYTRPTITPTPTISPTPTVTPTPTPYERIHIEKEMIDPPANPVQVGDIITFRIRVVNEGSITLTQVRFVDWYPSTVVSFVDATPPPDEINPPYLIWHDLTTSLGDIPPGGSVEVIVRFRAETPEEFARNCARVELAVDAQGNQWNSWWGCAIIQVIPEPPEINVFKVPLDPVVCVGDIVRFGVGFENIGSVPISTFNLTDLYDTTYLASLNLTAIFGPDDGQLNYNAILLSPIPPGAGMVNLLVFRAKAQTPSTTDEVRFFVNGDPGTEDSATAAVTILGEPGPCEGDLVVNGGFEDGWTGWTHTPQARLDGGSHSGATALLLGILPSEPDAARVDAAFQTVHIPPDAHHAILDFWFNVDNKDPRPDFNALYLIIHGESLSGSINLGVNSGGWIHMGLDLSAFIGENVSIQFRTLNDGSGVGTLWARIDDVRLCLVHCGPPVPTDGWTPGMCWKASYPDYAPNGVPDFDQRGYAVDRQTLFPDGPVAAANSLWWFDSKFETGATPPPTISDHYPLVEAYGQWDDHDPRNVAPLVLDLAARAHTDGIMEHAGDWLGTRPEDLAEALRAYLRSKGLLGEYSVTLEAWPSHASVYDRVRRSEDVLLLLGFWEHQPDGWRRLGGHWVTAAGMECLKGVSIAISDPFLDAAEAGYPGRYLPTVGHSYPHTYTLHNDAAFISHDVYGLWQRSEGGRMLWGLMNYVRRDPTTQEWYPPLEPFMGANTPPELAQFQAEEHQGGPIETRVEYMVVVARAEDRVSLSLIPAAAEVRVGEVFPVDIVAESRTTAFDAVEVHLDFDPALLRCVDGEGNPVTGIITGALPLVLQNAVDNMAGHIDFVARVPLGGTAVTGRIHVGRFYLQALAETPAAGSRVEFAWSGERMTDILAGANSVLGRIGELTVLASTPATLHGQVTLQGRPPAPNQQWAIPLTGELRDAVSGEVLALLSPTTDTRGRFTMPGLAPGTYDIRIKGMHTLANVRARVVLAPGENTIDLGTLLEGDADNDNDVDATDASLVNLAFGTAPGNARWDPRADFNEDNVVNATDMALLAANFGRRGDIPIGAAAGQPWAGAPVRLAQAAAAEGAAVSIGFSPSPITVDKGQIFTVNVVIHAGTQPVDAVQAYIAFPAGILRVVDAAGNPTDRVQGGTAFTLELTNSVDNSTGLIRYAATVPGGSRTGDVVVATLRFKAMQPSALGYLRFGVWEPTRTDVTYLGQSLLTAWPATPVTVRGTAYAYLPFAEK